MFDVQARLGAAPPKIQTLTLTIIYITLRLYDLHLIGPPPKVDVYSDKAVVLTFVLFEERTYTGELLKCLHSHVFCIGDNVRYFFLFTFNPENLKCHTSRDKPI